MGSIVKIIVDVVVAAVEAAIKLGKPMREALAESLEVAAANIRSGALKVDDALEQAREDQARIEKLRARAAKG